MTATVAFAVSKNILLVRACWEEKIGSLCLKPQFVWLHKCLAAIQLRLILIANFAYLRYLRGNQIVDLPGQVFAQLTNLNYL